MIIGVHGIQLSNRLIGLIVTVSQKKFPENTPANVLTVTYHVILNYTKSLQIQIQVPICCFSVHKVYKVDVIKIVPVLKDRSFLFVQID